MRSALDEAIARRENGQETLLVLDSHMALTEGVLPMVEESTGLAGTAAVTALIFGHHTVGVEPEPLRNLDTVITFDNVRAAMRWYPTIDQVRSRSILLEDDSQSVHAKAVVDTQRILQRYADIHIGYEMGGLDTLWYIDDDPLLPETIHRARRLHAFLTQPFYGVEPWTGTLGRYVGINETVAGISAILTGETDALQEEALMFIGSLDEAKEE